MRVSCTFAETETLLYNNRPDRSQYRTCSKRRPSLKGVYKKKKKDRNEGEQIRYALSLRPNKVVNQTPAFYQGI
jgi:hypothetical protein